MKIKTRIKEDALMVAGVCVGSVHHNDEWVHSDGKIHAEHFWFADCRGSVSKFRTRDNALKYMELCLDLEDGFIEVKWNDSCEPRYYELRTETETIGNVFNDGTWVANPYNMEGRDGFETAEEAMNALEEMLEVVK